MKKLLIYLVGLLLLTTACDWLTRFGGKVVDETNGKPLENVKIISSQGMTTYSDSVGHFAFHVPRPGVRYEKLELLVSKEGYETKYFDLSAVRDINKIEISIKPSSKPLEPRYSPTLVKDFYWVNVYGINLICLFTLGFILFGKIKDKWIWIIAILVLNFTLRFNYFDGHFDMSAFHTPFYLKHYSFYPFTIKIELPVATIAFWIGYFVSRTKVAPSADSQTSQE